jgi:hypothetical protein
MGLSQHHREHDALDQNGTFQTVDGLNCTRSNVVGFSKPPVSETAATCPGRPPKRAINSYSSRLNDLCQSLIRRRAQPRFERPIVFERSDTEALDTSRIGTVPAQALVPLRPMLPITDFSHERIDLFSEVFRTAVEFFNVRSPVVMFGRPRRPPENVVSVATETKPFARSQFYADAVPNVISAVKTFDGTPRLRRPVSKPWNSNPIILPVSEYRASNLSTGSCGVRVIVTVCPRRMAKDDNVPQLTHTALWIVRTISAAV